MLKTCYRQCQQYSKIQTILKSKLISLQDTTFLNTNRLFTSPPRANGSKKWVDFVAAFWHCECVCDLSEKSFTTNYQKWCKKYSYYFSEDKAIDIYASCRGHFGVMPKTDTVKLLVKQAISQLQITSATLAALKQEVQSLTAYMPKYSLMMKMLDVGPTLGPQLMAEVGNVRRFHSRNAFVAFAIINASPYNSYPLAGRRFNFEIRASPYVKNYNFQIKFKNEIVYCNKTILVIQYTIIDFNNPYKHEVWLYERLSR